MVPNGPLTLAVWMVGFSSSFSGPFLRLSRSRRFSLYISTYDMRRRYALSSSCTLHQSPPETTGSAMYRIYGIEYAINRAGDDAELGRNAGLWV